MAVGSFPRPISRTGRPEDPRTRRKRRPLSVQGSGERLSVVHRPLTTPEGTRRGPRTETARPGRRDRARGRGRLREQGPRLPAAYLWSGGPRPGQPGAGAPLPGALVQGLAGRGQRSREQRADLRLQPAPGHDGAVVILVDMQPSTRVPSARPPALQPCGPRTPTAYDPLHMGRRARVSHPEQPRFSLRRGDARQDTDLGVRQFPTRESLGQQRRVPRARATRTFSRAAPRLRPIRQISQWVQERNPLPPAGQQHVAGLTPCPPVDRSVTPR